jgi:hypothetical protein
MTNQNTLSRGTKSFARVAFVGTSFLAMAGTLNATAAQWSCPLTAASGEQIGVLPMIAFAAASQLLQACFLECQWFMQDFFQMLVSFWLLLLVIAAAVVLRAASKRRIERFTHSADASGKETLGLSI